MTIALDESTVIDYIRSTDLATTFFSPSDVLQSEALTEGNVNVIFRVYTEQAGRRKSLLVKQALPHSWRYPDFKMPLDRSRVEYDVLQIEARYSPEQTVSVYWHDPQRAINVLEDLHPHLVLREGLMQHLRYPLLAQHVGLFLARSLFYTSDLHLPSAEKKEAVVRFNNPVMRKVQEDLVFSQPYLPHPNNRWTRLNDRQVHALYENDHVRSEVYLLKEAYLTHAQALLHNDLHSGSILVTQTETKVIDPEFAFYGPIGHDVGSFLAHLVLSYVSQRYHTPDPEERADYRSWLLETLRQTWNVFEAEFQRLWQTESNGEWPSPLFRRKYVCRLLQDSAGFGATEILRRTIGMAHVADIDAIPDEPLRAIAENHAINIALAWLLGRGGLASIDELIGLTLDAHPTYPY
jgi:5-methylthioribose kinase